MNSSILRATLLTSLLLLGLVGPTPVTAQQQSQASIDRWVLHTMTTLRQDMTNACKACIDAKGRGPRCREVKTLREAYDEKEKQNALALKRLKSHHRDALANAPEREEAKQDAGNGALSERYQAYEKANEAWTACANGLPLWAK